MSDDHFSRTRTSDLAAITFITNKILDLEKKLINLMATQSAGQPSYNQTITPADYSHKHRKSSILDLWTMFDEDDMVSDSDTDLASQQSIKAYVDANIGDLTNLDGGVSDSNYGAISQSPLDGGDATSF